MRLFTTLENAFYKFLDFYPMSLQYAYILALIQGIREYLDGVLNFGLAYSFVFVDE